MGIVDSFRDLQVQGTQRFSLVHVSALAAAGVCDGEPITHQSHDRRLIFGVKVARRQPHGAGRGRATRSEGEDCGNGTLEQEQIANR